MLKILELYDEQSMFLLAVITVITVVYYQEINQMNLINLPAIKTKRGCFFYFHEIKYN